MLKDLITLLQEHRTMCFVVTLFIIINAFGIIFANPTIATMCFFLVFETSILITIWFCAFVITYIDAVRFYLYNSFSQLILGVHLVAGMVVLGVYFTF